MNGPLDPAEARAWLDTHMNLERMVGVPWGSNRRVSPQPLSRMQALVELLGSPQLQYPAIHVTGTNGKTSVARDDHRVARGRRTLGGHRHEPLPGTLQRAHVVER